MLRNEIGRRRGGSAAARSDGATEVFHRGGGYSGCAGEDEWIFRFGANSGVRSRAERRPARLTPSIRLQAALRLRPRRALSSAEAGGAWQNVDFNEQPDVLNPNRIPVLPAQSPVLLKRCPVLLAPRHARRSAAWAAHTPRRFAVIRRWSGDAWRLRRGGRRVLRGF